MQCSQSSTSGPFQPRLNCRSHTPQPMNMEVVTQTRKSVNITCLPPEITNLRDSEEYPQARQHPPKHHLLTRLRVPSTLGDLHTHSHSIWTLCCGLEYVDDEGAWIRSQPVKFRTALSPPPGRGKAWVSSQLCFLPYVRPCFGGSPLSRCGHLRTRDAWIG